MFTRTYSFANLILLLVFLSGLVSACSPVGSSNSTHDQEHALLLQISSHVRLTGEPDLSSYVSNSPRPLKLASLRPLAAPATTTELDIVVDLYSTYLSRLQAGGNLTDSHVDKLATQLQRKIQNLNKRSEQLEKRRSRRRRGLAGFFRRVGRSIGRFVRQLGRALGRAAEYLIEDIAPDVIRNMVLTGQPLNAKVFWSGVRKLVRTRLKTAIGTHLARRGVPMGVLAKAGLNVDMESDERSEDNEKSIDNPENVEIGYGNHKVVVDNHGDNWGYFEWIDYWTNLPETELDRCQWLSKSTGNADAYLDDFEMELDFELDSGQLQGSFAHDGSYDITYQKSEWVLAGVIEDGWVQPAPDASGWIFGGTAVVDVTMHDRWRCHHCVPGEGGCVDMLVQWLDEEKTKEVKAKVEGWTEQVVPGKGDDLDRLLPGGVYTLIVSYEGPDADMGIDCESCLLPADFPPPVYLEE
jgi:hypothetical protein